MMVMMDTCDGVMVVVVPGAVPPCVVVVVHDMQMDASDDVVHVVHVVHVVAYHGAGACERHVRDGDGEERQHQQLLVPWVMTLLVVMVVVVVVVEHQSRMHH